LLAGMVLILICYFLLYVMHARSPVWHLAIYRTPNDKSALRLDDSAARRRLDRRQDTSLSSASTVRSRSPPRRSPRLRLASATCYVIMHAQMTSSTSSQLGAASALQSFYRPIPRASTSNGVTSTSNSVTSTFSAPRSSRLHPS
jgi:hypothetical protein